MSDEVASQLAVCLRKGEPAAIVTVEQAEGSTPRDAGAAMLVTADRTVGTIGGGRLEWTATTCARDLLTAGSTETTLVVPLGPEIGQCCGGRVTLAIRRAEAGLLRRLERDEQRERSAWPSVLIFGAGHVGRALARAVAPLPLRAVLIDDRPEQLGAAETPGIVGVSTQRMLAEVDRAPAGAAYVILTHDHALDSLITAAILERADFAYLGLIGSRTKRRRFERAFRDLGLRDDVIARMTCPIGGDRIRDKRPAVIAALTAAELIGVFARTSPHVARRLEPT